MKDIILAIAVIMLFACSAIQGPEDCHDEYKYVGMMSEGDKITRYESLDQCRANIVSTKEKCARTMVLDEVCN